MGVRLAAATRRNHYPTRRALREAGQSDLGTEARGAADRHLHTALGRATRCPFIREQSVANLPKRQRRFASLIGDRDPIVLHKEIPGMGRAKRYIITIASDDRAPLDKLCQSLIAVGATCDVLRNSFGQTNVRDARE